MNIEITLQHGEVVEFRTGLPADYRGPVLKGATAVHARTNAATLNLQQLNGENYFIRLSAGRFFKRISTRGWYAQYGLYMNFLLKNDARKKVDTIGRFHLRKDQYIGYLAGDTNCSVQFQQKEDFSMMDIFYSPALLEELIPYFPDLQRLLKESPQSILNGRGGWCIPSMKEITSQLLDCPYDEASRQFYFDLKVRELLFQILQTTFKRNTTAHPFTDSEITRIHEARKILTDYIDKKPPSIKWLSRQVALNEFKLKKGFRQYFDAGIFEWLQEQKMQHARQLLLTTNKPIKDICSSVGYPRITNFITAFRRRFGVTPGSLRRQ
jgi:AraC-like DNA-binding protein